METLQPVEFKFDRPGEHGLATRSFGEGVLTATEAREVVVDQIRDELLRHYDPSLCMTDATGHAA